MTDPVSSSRSTTEGLHGISEAPAARPTLSGTVKIGRRTLTLDELAEGILAGNRATLARGITLVESNRAEDLDLAQGLLQRLLPQTGGAHRVGFSGVPGAGKSTLIEAVGVRLTAAGHKVAVLAIDPTSSVTGGSILGDKTRMNKLATDANAFIRPSPSGGALGGVARKTRETMLLCEAAGFDVIIVETVGVGQNETVVAEMVDCFLLTLIAGGGDELQGIKRGVVELADIVLINKADGNNQDRAKLSAGEYRRALHYMRSPTPPWEVPVLTCSAVTGDGLDELWATVHRHHEELMQAGALQRKRQQQQVRWMWAMTEQRLMSALKHHPQVQPMVDGLQRDVADGKLSPTAAAQRILAAFGVDGL